MIYTLTLNPALDRTIILDELNLGSVNRSSKTILESGGKGINVSKLIKNYGEETCALGFIGSKNKDTFLGNLDMINLNYDFIEVEGETRTNIKIVETKKNVFTDINQTGFKVTDSDISNLIIKISNLVKKDDVFVLSGSLPIGINNDIYRNLIYILKDIGAKTVLDAEGDALKLGLSAYPDLIKPNIDELKRIVSIENDVSSIIYNVQNILGPNCMAVVSMGSKGSVCIGNSIYKALPITLNVKSTVGAGDSMVAGLSIGLAKQMNSYDAFKLSVAASSAKVTLEGTKSPTKEHILSMMPYVVIEEMV